MGDKNVIQKGEAPEGGFDKLADVIRRMAKAVANPDVSVEVEPAISGSQENHLTNPGAESQNPGRTDNQL